jgi:multiple sugar transport system permease protein
MSRADPVPGTRPKSPWSRWEWLEAYIFISPWLIGFTVFVLGPMLASFCLSFTQFDPRSVELPRWVGLDNYRYALENVDEKFYRSLVTTIVYSVVSVPLGLSASLLLALLLSRDLRGMGVFRTICYLPAVLPTIAVGMVFVWLFNTDLGLVNAILKAGGLPAIDWLGNPRMILPSYVIVSLWGVGGNMMVLIAAIKAIPRSLYEAAIIDGAKIWQRFRHVTLPQLSFVLFFNLVTGVIGAFQVFDIAYVMGGAEGQHPFYVLYLYEMAWSRHKMGYASALAWLLFGIVLAATSLVMKSSPLWVYYEGERGGR